MSVRYEHVNSVKRPDIYRWDECNFGGRSQESIKNIKPLILLTKLKYKNKSIHTPIHIDECAHF